MGQDSDRRSCPRLPAEDVLDDPACYVASFRVKVLDVSPSGFRLLTPPQLPLSASAQAVLSFSDRHGRYRLSVSIRWTRDNEVGVEVTKDSTNLVGKMFVKKLIAQYAKRAERRARLRR